MAIAFFGADTGIGVPLDKQSRLFKSFQQVDASTTRHYGGTGLGLAISKRLAELFGGKIWVDSDAGKGATFHFTIGSSAARGQPATLAGPATPFVRSNGYWSLRTIRPTSVIGLRAKGRGVAWMKPTSGPGAALGSPGPAVRRHYFGPAITGHPGIGFSQ